MENFFDLSRGNSSYDEYQAMFDLAWMDVSEQANLQMNDVGKAFWLLRGAGLTDRQLFDLRLRVDGDMSKYQEIRGLLSRMFADGAKTRSSTIPQMAGQYLSDWHDDGWNDDNEWYQDTWYQDDGWLWQEQPWDSSCLADSRVNNTWIYGVEESPNSDLSAKIALSRPTCKFTNTEHRRVFVRC